MGDNTVSRLPTIDYSSRDFSSIVTDLISAIPFYLPEWTDHNWTDLGILLIQLQAQMGDVLHWLADRKFNECFLPTAVNRSSVVNLTKLIDYELSPAVPATVTLKFTIPTALGGDVTIPKGFEVEAQDEEGNSIYFETDEDVILTAGEVSVTVGATQGQTIEEDEVGVSDGTEYQVFELQEESIIASSIVISIDEGGGFEEWEEVDSFQDKPSTATDKHYLVRRTDEDLIRIELGDNINGKIPTTNAIIKSVYRVGGGVYGNVAKETIDTVNDTISFGGDVVALSVINEAKAENGLDEESVEKAKLLAPRSLRALNRAVTKEDFETLTMKVDGVAKARAEFNNIRDVNIYVAPYSGTAPSQTLKDNIKAYLEPRKIATFEPIIKDPRYIYLHIKGKIYVYPNYLEVDVKNFVEVLTLDPFFTLENQAFGQGTKLSEVYNKIKETEGVDYLDLEQLRIEPYAIYETWSGDAEITDILTSNNTIAEIWTIKMTSATAFTVSGSVSGLQVATGLIDTEYTSDNNQVVFTLASKTTAVQAQDNAWFKVSGQLQNITLEDLEIIGGATYDFEYIGGAG